MELDWLKKKSATSVEEKRALIKLGHPQLSRRRPCVWLGLARSSLYDPPVRVSAEDLQRMRLLDEQYTMTPLYGVRRMTAWLRSLGYAVTPTHVRLEAGCVSLVAVIDWCSRYVRSWAVSITMDVACCLEALEQALRQGHPEIFTTDQGAQLTSQECTARLQKGGVRISMDGRGRALDHVCVERLWRRVTYEDVSVRDDQSVWDARQKLARYFRFYNEARLHQALGYRTPAAVYHGGDRDMYLARQKPSIEALETNFIYPKNGLDNGEHNTIPALRIALSRA